MGNSEMTFNAVQTAGTATFNKEGSDLYSASGASLDYDLSWTNAQAPGEPGVVKTGERAANAYDGGSEYSTIFGDNIVSGTSLGGCANGDGSLPSITISGLAAGQQFDLYMLTGRGNNYTGGNVTESSPYSYYTIQNGNEDGFSQVSITMLGASSTNSSIDGAELQSYEYNPTADANLNWALVKWRFTADETGSVTIKTLSNEGVTHGGNINAIALVAASNAPAVPEPATATLSLLALAGLCARRRRK